MGRVQKAHNLGQEMLKNGKVRPMTSFFAPRRSKLIRWASTGYGVCALWRGVSEMSQEFVRELVVMDLAKRWTADAALEHPCLKVGSGR